MDLRELGYFLAVAREGNISRAAELIHVSQPTLSRTVMQLEEEVGKPLLVRTNRDVSLTAEGLLLKNRAEELLGMADKMMLELRGSEQEISGRINIGSGETDTFGYLADAAASFRQQYPSVTFQVFSGNSDEIKERLENGLLDFGLVNLPVDLARYECEPFPVDERWGVLVLPDHPLACKEWVTAEDIRREPLIFPQRIRENPMMAAWLDVNVWNWQIAAEYNLINNAMMLLQKGVGIVFCIEKVFYRQLGLVFIPFEPERKAVSVLVYRKGHALSPAAKLFLKEFRNLKNK